MGLSGAGGGFLAGRRAGCDRLTRRHLVHLGPGGAPLAAGGPEEAAAGAPPMLIEEAQGARLYVQKP